MSLAEFVQRPLRTVGRSCSLREAARQMLEHSVGALVITDDSGSTPLHIVTDRDLVVMLAEGLDPDEATVECLAFPRLRTIAAGATLADAARVMREVGVRRLPIVDEEGRLVGLVSLDDVLLALGREMADVQHAIGGELGHERDVASIRARLRGGEESEPPAPGSGSRARR